jgi:hypothetical protein
LCKRPSLTKSNLSVTFRLTADDTMAEGPSTAMLWSPTGCTKCSLDTQRYNPLYSSPLKASSPAFAGSHGHRTVEECGCPPTCPAKLQRSRKPLDRHSFSGGGWRPSSAVALLRRMERRTGASSGYAVPQVPRAPARGAHLTEVLRLKRTTLHSLMKRLGIERPTR